MKPNNSFLLLVTALLFSVLLVPCASAAMLTYSGAGFTIGTNTYSAAYITVPDNFTVKKVTLTINMTFPSAGDLTYYNLGDLSAKLTGPNISPGVLTTVNLFNFPADYPYGSSPSYRDLYVMADGSYSFDDSVTTDFYTAAWNTASGGTMASGTYHSSIDPLSLFNGVNSQGNYGLIIGNYSDHQGTINSWSITLSSVPLPAAAWLFASGLIALVSFTRRRKKHI